jgi:ATP-dependent DNA helicase RecG
MSVDVELITDEQQQRVLATEEGQFSDLKAIEVSPAKLTRHISALANSDGGELFIGIDEVGDDKKRVWRGFKDQESANSHLQTFEAIFPLGQDFGYTFLRCQGAHGILLQIDVKKTQDIKRSSNGTIYIRRGAQSLPVTTPEAIRQLEYTKGLSSFESELTRASADVISNSLPIIGFMLEVIPTAEPLMWLQKQTLVRDNRATVAGVLLFSEEPQAILPKRCGIKIYRYKTREMEGFRDALVFDPITIEGCLYEQIERAVSVTIETVEDIPKLGDTALESIKYPQEALQEIITNAVLHRDYSIADDVHIRIFDNRIEIQSPGRLPAHVTPENILEERFARNGTIVRLLNKFPNPPNKDVGEGLNTAYAAMNRLGLKEPIVTEKENSVLVFIRHERLASPEVAIVEYLQSHETIKNQQARRICHIDGDYKIKNIFQDMSDKGLIEKVPGTRTSSTAYRLPKT